MHILPLLPGDIIAKIGSYHHILDGINFATAMGIRIGDIWGDIIPVSDHITLISDDIELYRRNVTTFQGKCSKQVLTYHIKAKNADILQLLEENCYLTFDSIHVILALESCSNEILKRVVDSCMRGSNMSERIKDRIIITALKNKRFDELDFVCKCIDRDSKKLERQFRYLFSHNLSCDLDVYERFGYEINDYCKLSITLLRQIIESGHFILASTDLYHCLSNCGKIKHLGTVNFIEDIKCGLTHMNSMNEPALYEMCVHHIFMHFGTRIYDVTVWMHDNFELNQEDYIYVCTIKIFRFLYKYSYSLSSIEVSDWKSDTFEDKLWYCNNIIVVDEDTMIELLCSKQFDVFVALLSNYHGNSDKFFTFGDRIAIDALLVSGRTIHDPTTVFNKKVEFGTLDELKCIHELHPTVQLHTVKKFLSECCLDKIKWLCETFKPSQYDIIQIFICLFAVDCIPNLSWMLQHYDIKASDVAKTRWREITDENKQYLINKKIL